MAGTDEGGGAASEDSGLSAVLIVAIVVNILLMAVLVASVTIFVRAHKRKATSLESAEAKHGEDSDIEGAIGPNEGGTQQKDRGAGLEQAGVADRLDRLEREVLNGSLLPGAALADEHLPGSIFEEKATSQPRRPSTREAATNTEAVSAKEIHQLATPCKGTWGPSQRQKRLPVPPEKRAPLVDQDTSLRLSLVTVQRKLGQRDAQTQELTKQLRACQQELWQQTLEAKSCNRKFKDLLANPSLAPRAQAEELRRLQAEIEDLSSRLADTKSQEMQWSLIAKRQRAFFMQTERVGQEGLNILRKHPCGEVFIAPPPDIVGADEEDLRRPPWDVGTSNMNPYATDSWPFEPNVLAQRASAEPSLNRWAEGQDAYLSDSDGSSEDGTDSHGARLPSLPDDVVRPLESDLVPLPALPSELPAPPRMAEPLSARSV